MTPLDRAHAAMEAAPEADGARLAFHARLLEAELHLLLAEEPEGGRIEPMVLEIEGGRYALAFDLAERLAALLDAPAPSAVLSGRALAGMLVGGGAGLAVNLGAASATLLPPEAVAWLAALADEAPVRREGRPVAFHPPLGAGAGLIAALDPKLAGLAAHLGEVWLVEAEYAEGGRGLLLALAGAPEAAELTIAAAIGEAVRLGGMEDSGLDLVFLPRGAALLDRVARVGLRFDLPRAGAARKPDRPPVLR